MVAINKITEPTSYLFNNDEMVGEINSSLQLNDCLLQIFRNKYVGYKLLYNGIEYPILPNGRIKSGGSIYPLYSEQMKEIIGF